MRSAITMVKVAFVCVPITFLAASFAPIQAAVRLGAAPSSPGIAADLERLPAEIQYAAFVHFRSGSPGEHRKLLEGHGLTVTADFERFANAVYAIGVVGEFRALTHEPSVSYLEENAKLLFMGDTAPWASRARVAQEAVSGGPYFSPGGSILRGDGVGIAVVDSGVNALHPDLANRIVKNYKVICTTPLVTDPETGRCFGQTIVEDVGSSVSTDTTSGHGTHVAGIVAGEGLLSTGDYPIANAAPSIRGTFTGVAPGAGLYVFGAGELLTLFNATEALQFVLDNYDQFSPRIRVMNISAGEAGGTAYDPDRVFSRLVRALVGKGVIVTFPAGNAGGSGETDATSSFCKDPTPGVICVAMYNDGVALGAQSGTGNRNNVLAPGSSRGRVGNPETYPDLAAPGSFITSTCDQGLQPICTSGEARWPPRYGTISSTSMASAHVAGAVALLLQARPDLTPAAIEDLLQDTAHKLDSAGPYEADPQNPGSTVNYAAGAGLVDLSAALRALGTPGGDSAGGGVARVRVTDPLEGQDFDGSESIPVAGTAGDGAAVSRTPYEQLILDGDLDTDLPGAADIVRLTVEESPANAVIAGLRYRITLRDATDFRGLAPISLRVSQNTDGRPVQISVATSALLVTAAPPASSATRNGNVIEVFVPMLGLGDPSPGVPVHNIFATSVASETIDVAPSPATGAGTDALLRPMFGRPYTILRPTMIAPPTAEVRFSVDGGSEQPAVLSGASPSYAWTGVSIDSSTLAEGVHTLAVRLYLNGVAAAVHQVNFSVTRAPDRDNDGIPDASDNCPDHPNPDQTDSDGDGIGNACDAPADADGDGVADGADNCPNTANPDQADADGDGIGNACEAPSGGVSCHARSMGFWRQQFERKANGSQKFTTAESNRLGDHAAGLSDGYFGSRDVLVQALFSKGNAGPERRAARQYAGLLLNLAGGDLSDSMSYQAGLSGKEVLDPAVYDTGKLGTNVDSATRWIRDQLPGGDLGGANEAADSVNNGQGLICQ